MTYQGIWTTVGIAQLYIDKNSLHAAHCWLILFFSFFFFFKIRGYFQFTHFVKELAISLRDREVWKNPSLSFQDFGGVEKGTHLATVSQNLHRCYKVLEDPSVKQCWHTVTTVVLIVYVHLESVNTPLCTSLRKSRPGTLKTTQAVTPVVKSIEMLRRYYKSYKLTLSSLKIGFLHQEMFLFPTLSDTWAYKWHLGY